MLSTKFRLKTKDVKFLVKKGKIIFSKYFWMTYFLQYPNLDYNQISVNIWLKYSKRAVNRNKLKRQIITQIQNHNLTQQKINWKYFKIFIYLNKKNIEETKKQIDNTQDLPKFLYEQVQYLITKIK